MEPVTLAASALAILVPYLKKGAEEFTAAAGQVAYEKTRALLAELKRRWIGDREASGQLEQFERRGGSSFANPGRGDTAGHGYIRIDTIDRSGIQLGFDPLAALTIGSFMLVFPPVVPRLDVIEVAGRAIAPGAPAEILLPPGTDPNQTIVVRGSDFVGAQAIEVALVPSNGPRQVYDAEIDMSTNPDQVTVDVAFPVNVRTRVWAWTR